MIAGVTLHPLKQITLPKGDLWHAFKATDDGFAGFGEAYFTQVNTGETKGWKRHNRYTLNLVVLQGEIRFVIYDDREESATKGQFETITLSPNANYQRLTVAPGLWMAFSGMSKGVNMLMDLIPEVHNPEESDKKELDEINFTF